jgi:hypothetical protein
MSLLLNVFPIDSKPFGLSYSEWCIKWWQWISCIPKYNNPALDWSGIKVYEHQNDSRVLFLCQTYEGVKNTPLRRNKITKGSSIFMPIINWISIMDNDGNSDGQLLDIARSKMDVVGPLEITINGIKVNKGLENFRIESPFFEINLPEKNLFGLSAGKRRCVSDGYWIFLRPIFESTRLSSFASCSSGATKIKVNYDLIAS